MEQVDWMLLPIPGLVKMAKEALWCSVYFRGNCGGEIRSIPCKFCGYYNGEEMEQMLVEATQHLFPYIHFLQVHIYIHIYMCIYIYEYILLVIINIFKW